jgi:ATP/maltotriose-dependent transcriptional regulator MalT
MPSATHEVVGRERELERLAAFVDSISTSPVVMLLEGAPGIGKTTLWTETVSLAEQAGHRVLVSRPLEAEAGLSFAGLGDLLDRAIDEALLDLPIPQRAALEIALLRSERKRASAEPRALGLAVLGVLRKLSASTSVLLAVDDLHWLDVPSARALQFAVHRLTDEPIGILLSSRGGDGTSLELARLVPERRLNRIEIEPLSSGALARLLRTRYGPRFTRATLLRLHTTTGGNPFFALEIARALEKQGLEPGRGEPLPVPEDLAELLQDRLQQLPARTRTALAGAAAAADPTATLVTAVSGDEAEGSALEPAVEAGVITLDGERVRFTHPLLASVVYSATPPEERRQLHAALADAVADLEERAVHLATAVRGPDHVVAATLESAAAAARARGAPETAADLGEQAWRLTPPEDLQDVGRRQIEAAEHHLQAGDPTRARVLLERATSTLQPGPVRAHGLLALSRIQADETVRWDEPLTTLEEALQEVRDDVRLRAEIERQLAWACAADLRASRAEPHARAALELAEGLGDRVLLAEALAVYACVEFQRGRGLRHELIERALALETLYEHSRVSCHPNWPFEWMLFWTGDYRAARSCLKTLLKVAEERGEESATPWLLCAQSEVELAAGNWDVALRLTEEAYTEAVGTGQDSLRRDALAARARVDAHQGRTGAARIVAEEQLATGSHFHRLHARALLGFIELSLEDSATASSWMAPLLRDVGRNGVEDPSVYRFWPDAIEALIATGELIQAEPLLAMLEERGRTLGRPSALAIAARCSALLFAASGDIPGAQRAAEDALRTHDAFTQPFELARTLLIKGRIARRAKKKRVAREVLTQALNIFDGLGAVLWSRQALEELSRIGGRAPARGELTPAEEQVATLVAEGRANREVAAVLYLSENTIESHLTHIYSKLGVHSRTELARRLTTQRSFRPNSD